MTSTAVAYAASKRVLISSLSVFVFGVAGVTVEPPTPALPPPEPEDDPPVFPTPAATIPVEYAPAWHEFTAYQAGVDEPEEAPEQKPVPVRPKVKAAPSAPVKIPKQTKKPNQIVIPFSQAPPIASQVRKVNGKNVCAHKDDDPHKSYQGKKVHIDRQCCLDPDEIPNPRCHYPKLEKAR
ncbi:MAG: hypothetical protein IPJ68_04010 [Candidatus Moraniibacteriota bacterium]|nr:MAG: hypothetical protein IPJ68_04010 [Candidatus Moranbacteria bacterium]